MTVDQWMTQTVRIDEPISEDQAKLATALGDDYQFISTIGSGGCGTVYKVFLKSLDRVVAVKVIPGDTDVNAVRRLHLEAQALADLKHENIVEVLRFGAHANCCALVMEFVDGQDLDSIIKTSGPLSSQRCRLLMAQCASALEAAHTHHIIHRDIKPANILIAKNDEAETIKLVDFGIAKQLERTDQKLTKTGMVVGTPAFMSPEVCRSETVDGRTDIYSLGCVFYTALTGKMPMEGESAYEVMYNHLSARVPAVNIADDALSNIITKCTEPMPENRFQTAAELLQALQSQDFVYHDTWSPAPISKIPRWTGAALAFLTLVVIVGLAIIYFDKSKAGTSQELPTALPTEQQAKELKTKFIATYGKAYRYLPIEAADKFEQFKNWSSDDHREIARAYSLCPNINTPRLRTYQIEHLKNSIKLIHKRSWKNNPYKEIRALGRIYLDDERYADAENMIKEELGWEMLHNEEDVVRYQIELAAIATIRNDAKLYREAVALLDKSSLTREEIATDTASLAKLQDKFDSSADPIIAMALKLDPNFPYCKSLTTGVARKKTKAQMQP